MSLDIIIHLFTLTFNAKMLEAHKGYTRLVFYLFM